MQVDWRKAVTGGLLAIMLAGCASTSPKNNVEARDPTARAFAGTIISLRPYTSTMIISKDEHLKDISFPNEIKVKYDAQTKFYLDGQPTTIDQLKPYMPVQVSGHMRGEQMFAEDARFSSNVPVKVVPATQAGR